MRPAQWCMFYEIRQRMRQFYHNPRNEERFLKWKEERRAINPATDLPPRAPSRCLRPEESRRTANLTASAT
jgi:hypothetical protein